MLPEGDAVQVADNLLLQRHPDTLCILLANAEIVTRDANGQRIAHRSYHFYPYRFARYAAHLHQRKPEVRIIMIMNPGFPSCRQLRQAYGLGIRNCFHAAKVRVQWPAF